MWRVDGTFACAVIFLCAVAALTLWWGLHAIQVAQREVRTGSSSDWATRTLPVLVSVILIVLSIYLTFLFQKR